MVIVAHPRFHRDRGPAYFACLRTGGRRTRLDRNGEATVIYQPVGVWAAVLVFKEVGPEGGAQVIRLTNVRTGLHYETGGAGTFQDITTVRLEPTGTAAYLIRVNVVGQDELYACPMPYCYPHSRQAIRRELVDKGTHIPDRSITLRHGVLRWIRDGEPHVLDLHA
jgi:hypothetical protein